MAAQDEDDAMAFSWQARVSGHAFCVWQGIRKLTLVVWVRKGLLCVFVPGRGKKVAPRIPSCLPASFPTRAGPGCRPQGRGPSVFHGQTEDADHRGAGGLRCLPHRLPFPCGLLGGRGMEGSCCCSFACALWAFAPGSSAVPPHTGPDGVPVLSGRGTVCRIGNAAIGGKPP